MSADKLNACFVCSVKFPGISLHRFPTDRDLRTRWLSACGLSEMDYKSSRRICSLHFENNCFNKFNVRKCLYPGSVPTKFPDSYINRQFTDVYKLRSRRRRSRYSTLTPQHVDDTLLQRDDNSSYISPKFNANRSPLPYVSPSCNTNNLQSVSNINRPQNVGPMRQDTPSPEETSYCPITMLRYENTLTGFPTMWVCRICLCAIMSEKGAQNHFITCQLPIEMSDVDEEEVDEKYDESESENIADTLIS